MVRATVHAADTASRENLDARQACERESGGDSRGAVHATRHGDAQIPTADFSNALSAEKPLQIIAFQSENWLPARDCGNRRCCSSALDRPNHARCRVAVFRDRKSLREDRAL